MSNKIALNFLAIKPQEFDFLIYRKVKEGNERRPAENIYYYSLPKTIETDNWTKYWISFNKMDGFEEYQCHSTTNFYLTENILFQSILEKIKGIIPDKIARISYKFNKRRIFICINTFNEGKQTIWLEPYFLRATGELGFLLDFHFLREENISFSKKIQKLSLSLDATYHSNKSYHQDKYQFVLKFTKDTIAQLIPLNISKNTISLSNKLTNIESDTLHSKIYRFSKEQTKNSQFMGIKEFGPFNNVKNSVHYFFVFKEEHIDLGRDLVKALNGETFKYTFPGMAKMFNMSLKKKNVSKITIASFTNDEIDRVINEINNNQNENKVAILIFPEIESDFYYNFKNQFLIKGILTQGIHIETLKNTNGFKWSISSIGLQIFSKSSGIPWRVKPSNENCLIIGIGQAHRFIENKCGNKQIDKFYSYSVLIDSSGEYISLNVLSNDNNENDYLINLQKNVSEIISNYKDKYQKITFHIPFKIKTSVLNKITDAINQLNIDKEFVVIKINDNSKFFGYNTEINSLVPFESSFLKLSDKEYLVWPEGLNYHNRNTLKRYANPLHIDFYYSNIESISDETKQLYIQDILNLSGANWRGFNAKAIPISMFYPKLISGFIKEFNFRNLPEVNFENLPPWFL